MLNRLLIANRGEIAVRVARTARRMGITTIAVCSDEDLDAPHVRACDEHVNIGGRTPAESYLDIEKILAAARKSHAQAIHPGYGFLSENARFASAVEARGLIFVGPPAEAIEAMGDKARARRRMAAAGIEVIPGYDGEDQDEARLLGEAERIGFPLMVKAAAGGGGRGMRRVAGAEQLPAALRSACSEAAKAFGDGRLILERAVVEPRHVEIQVLADGHGQVIHVGERDCSVQRRHQKIVEESPSPAVDAALRERMGEAATAVAREIGYRGAGTVEFLLDRDGRFYFMEMNTRLQVEHPVTEMVTGLDLVELQLKVARGEGLPLTQRDLRIAGHAIEVRLCAEDPADDFLPRSGRVLDWRPDDLTRCDHAIATDMQVSAYYDSMLAKVIAHGSTRAEALDRLARALERTSLLGMTTNRAFLARVLRHEVFQRGEDVSTAFIERCFPDTASRACVPDERLWALSGWVSVACSPEALSVPDEWRDFSSGDAPPVRWRLELAGAAPAAGPGDTAREGRLLLQQRSARLRLAEREFTIRARTVPPGRDGQAEIDGEEIPFRYAWSGTTLWLHTPGGDFEFRCRRRDPLRSAADAASSAALVRANINGRVVDIAVTPGAQVRRGERLVVLEAMKMEHELLSPRDGQLETVEVNVGDQVSPGQVLVSFAGGSEPAGGPGR
ncbi:MAG TPA: biotin carboxylase N-terminal domain-containing protein [Steroidobacteraceae bacterium]|nr:biotin carboxylase N-terminal domain-containing protein [Steroidobacteraceae bacterium]